MATRKPEPYVVGGTRRLKDLELTLPQVLDKKGEPRTFRVNPDPDVDLVGLLLQIEEAIRTGEDAELSVASALVEGKAVIIEMLQEWNDDVPENIKLGAGDVLEIVAFLNGGKSAAQSVAQSITRAADAFADEAGTPPDLEESGIAAAEDGEEGGTPLRSSTKGKSSRSAKRTTGRRTTGSGSRTASGKRNSSRRRAA